jgi:4-amino-4-deoxychorismate lyase
MPFLRGHLRRMNRARQHWWSIDEPISFSPVREFIRDYPHGLFKIRIIYGPAIQSIEVLPYAVKPVKSLRLVDGGDLNYAFKFADREALTRLLSEKNEADDILIYRQNLVTDTSYTNIVFGDGAQWFTPAQPLLEGVQRSRLIESGKIKKIDIDIKSIAKFKTAKLINAMMTWQESPEIPVSKIYGMK